MKEAVDNYGKRVAEISNQLSQFLMEQAKDIKNVGEAAAFYHLLEKTGKENLALLKEKVGKDADKVDEIIELLERRTNSFQIEVGKNGNIRF